MRMLHALTLAALIAASSAHAATEDTNSRKFVLTDGTNIWPKNTIAPYIHTHTQSQIQGLNDLLSTYLTKALAEATYQPKGDYLTTESDPTVSAWAKAATKPTYAWTEILNRPTTWDWANLTNKPTTFTPAAHTHTIADTTGLQAALDSLAPISSVTCTTNNVTYIWQWDDDAGTFALVER